METWPWKAFQPYKRPSLARLMWPETIIALKGENDDGKSDMLFILDTFDAFETCFCFRKRTKQLVVINNNQKVVEELRHHYGV